jgi:hypothetical protein
VSGEQLSVARDQWSVLNETKSPFLSFPSSCLGTHLDAKLQLGNRKISAGLAAVKQSRALGPSRFPSRSLGTRGKNEEPNNGFDVLHFAFSLNRIEGMKPVWKITRDSSTFQKEN